MPYRNPPRREVRASSRFAFRSARMRIGAVRFELSFHDYVPLLAVVSFGALFVVEGNTAARLCVVAALIGVSSARRVLVVTTESACFEHRVFGVPWRRFSLGLRPTIATDLGWDWCEIAVTPHDSALRAPLTDRERAVLVEWGETDVHANEDAERICVVARSEIERLHGA